MIDINALVIVQLHRITEHRLLYILHALCAQYVWGTIMTSHKLYV